LDPHRRLSLRPTRRAALFRPGRGALFLAAPPARSAGAKNERTDASDATDSLSAHCDAEFEREVAAVQRALQRIKAEVAAVAAEIKFRRFLRDLQAGRFRDAKAGFNPDQPRVAAGNPDGGQWTSEDGTSSQTDQTGLEQSHEIAADQPLRSDIAELLEITNDPAIGPRIDEAWTASNPDGGSPQEHGFWISRNDVTGELFTRPFAGSGAADSITPGPAPSDAVAFFHTHPNQPERGYRAGPSEADVRFSSAIGCREIVQSHNGIYCFGPSLRTWTPR
jgi:hypothetical protein